MRFEKFELPSMPEKGIVGIFGDNECGKSTMGELICFCIFGRTPKAPEGDPKRIIRWGQDTCTAEITFSAGEETYKIMRRLSADGTTDGRMIGVTKNRVLATTSDQIEARVADIFGYSFKEFRYSMFIAQKELDIILHSADDRRIVLNNMLGVGFMEKMAKKTAAKRIDRETEIKEFRKRINDKNEVLEVYRAREKDMQALDMKLDNWNSMLLDALRNRDRVKSTISMLDDIRRKSEQFEILDMRIKSRREQLKRIEAECSGLMRDSDHVPALHREINEKSARARELQEVRATALQDKFNKLQSYRELAEHRNHVQEQLDLKEAALSDITGRLEDIATLEDQMRGREAERSSIDFFIQSFSGENRFATMFSHLIKDVGLINSELDRVRSAVKRDLEHSLEREESFRRQQDRVRRQIVAATIGQIDQDQIIQSQIAERGNAKVRDISLVVCAACFISGFALTLILGKTVMLSAMLGMIPSLAVAVAFQSRVRSARQNLQELQRQVYAYNITQRGILELKESIEELDERIEKISSELKDTENTKNFIEGLKTGGFTDLDESINTLDKSGVDELNRARGLMRDVVEQYDNMRTLLDPKLAFEEIAQLDPAALLAEKEERRAWLEDQIVSLREKTAVKQQFMDQTEGLLNSIGALRTQIARIEAGMSSLEVTDADEPNMRIEEKEINLQIEQLRREIEQNETDISRIEAQTSRAVSLEEKRREIIREIDEDLIKFYELRESTHDIDCSDEKFAGLREELKKHEDRALEVRSAVMEIETEKKIIQRDLDRIPAVEEEVKEIAAVLNQKNTIVLKQRELENLFTQTGLDIKKRLVPQIESYFGWILPKLTRGRYHKVKLGDDFDIQVFSDESGGYVDIETLSGGTVDQLLISLRLAFARAATAHSGSPKQFLFLDEPFSSFDESRRELFFKILETLVSNFQQIFLISHLPGLEDFVDHYIKVDLGSSQPVVTSWT
jgi:DNA repair exonuclease SbcCD ATPase subunit